ncbi:MAG TPA: zf-HC2 domain-containing protein [Planctomycetota bacterium]|nr:zf-HC2 domain-containing protein [Planctomycetota bacterium]
MDHDQVIETLTAPERSVSAETRKEVDQHLATCKDCREVAEGVALYREAGKRAEEETARILAMAEAQQQAIAKLAPQGGLTCAQVAAYRGGTEPLDEATRLGIAAHCVACPTCSKLDAVEAARAESAPRGEVVRLPARTPVLRMAAMLVATLGLGLLVGRTTRPETVDFRPSLAETDDIRAAMFLKAHGFDAQARVLAQHFLDGSKGEHYPASVMDEARGLAK